MEEREEGGIEKGGKGESMSYIVSRTTAGIVVYLQ